MHAKMNIIVCQSLLEGYNTIDCFLLPRSILKQPEKWALSEKHFSSLFASVA